uniref:Uncharacterized protein n=1 Tax=Sphenodon punctatus TaxID=8508 RepID=A0A8D0H7Q4_SPHPU
MEKGEQMAWEAERKLLQQRLKLLQQAVARLENDKHGLEQRNTHLRATLAQVERERRRLKRSCGDISLSHVSGLPLADSGQDRAPALSKEEAQAPDRQLAELQKQVSLLQMQLVLERKQKRDYIECCTKTSEELSGLHNELSNSLAAVAREPEATVLEAETRKLDESLTQSLALATLAWNGLSPKNHPMSSTPKESGQEESR